ncbi:MAG TPA: 4a-hydroxytetrahydrobiopterin dehydratase [Abditibacteriaceae bacterium]|jgi:4a-hydroxytetrahydrobiopterin dehydratase
MQKLQPAQVTEATSQLNSWSVENESLVRTFEFTDFAHSMIFVGRVADLAESADHHPDIDIRYNKVKLVLSTHSAGGLTQKDIDLATQIEHIY